MTNVAYKMMSQPDGQLKVAYEMAEWVREAASRVSRTDGWGGVSRVELLLVLLLEFMRKNGLPELELGLALAREEEEGVPSHPRSICPLRNSASLIRSGSRPFRSTDARHPLKPSREATSLGRLLYMPGPKPAIKRSPT